MLGINLKGKRAFIAGIGDDQGFGWAIARALAEAGAEILVGTWPPVLSILKKSLESGKFDESRRLSDGRLMEFSKIYPLDAVYDTMVDVPESVRTNKRYQSLDNYAIKEVAEQIKEDVGSIDILVHSLANGPEVKNPLLETSRAGYLAAISASSYSFVSLMQHFGDIMSPWGAALTLSYTASTKAIPGYGGGMSSAKAALESDIRTLAYEAGQKWNVRLNAISAGPWLSRAAKAIGFLDKMVKYSEANSPLCKPFEAEEVGNTAAFLCSSLASAITGTTLFVDNGLHAMGIAPDSPTLEDNKPSEEVVSVSY